MDQQHGDTKEMSFYHIMIVVVMAIVACPAIFLVVRDTNRGSGRWGINFRRPACPNCGTPFPLMRRPENERQRLWGGGTCKCCGMECDKWGNPVDTKADDK